MNDYSDEDLLIIISFQNENEKEAKEAFKIFYNRHKDFLWSLCYSICTKNKKISEGKELAKDIFNNTMMSVYKSSHTYDSQKGKVRTWMSRIAKNEMCDLLKRETRHIPLNEDICPVINVDVEEEINIPSPEKKVLDEALNKLSEKETDILLTYMQYSDGNKHLPDEVLNELRQRYNTTAESLRQIKKRSLDKVKGYITSNTSTIINSKKNR
ncbi:MAG: sigma-70 family RNA polymerase sigma factor [Dysgonamonadaceae bacterium]|nr:sigma-70 family RNA polymerase sigma factor [Dysgonamonadaceae bacterium]